MELVLLDVSVKDAKGGYVSGLTKDNFHVSESGAPQNITVFSHADVPITAGLVMDASGSMLHKQQDVIMAGLVFAGASNPRDQLFVVNFNDSVRPGLPGNLPFSDQPPVLRLALSRARPEGRTALYDAVAYALDHLNAGDREKKALVLVTDGGDNCSKLTGPELMGLIERSHATIYTVGLFDEDDPDRNPRILNRIAHISGGECFLPQRLDEVIPDLQKDCRGHPQPLYARLCSGSSRGEGGYSPHQGCRIGGGPGTSDSADTNQLFAGRASNLLRAKRR